MMSRASRVLKWVGAATVLLAAAPIAYAESPSPAPDPNPPRRSSPVCVAPAPAGYPTGYPLPTGGVSTRGDGVNVRSGGTGISPDLGGLPYFSPYFSPLSPGGTACADRHPSGSGADRR